MPCEYDTERIRSSATSGKNIPSLVFHAELVPPVDTPESEGPFVKRFALTKLQVGALAVSATLTLVVVGAFGSGALQLALLGACVIASAILFVVSRRRAPNSRRPVVESATREK